MSAMDTYRVDRQEQDARYENLTGLSVSDERRQEFRDYFGVGDHSGRPVETRVTPRAAMVNGAAEREPTNCVTPAEAFACTGAQLALLALAGDYVAKDEIVRRWIKRAGARRRRAHAEASEGGGVKTNRSPVVVWRNHGRQDCKGNARSERMPDGTVKYSCDSCRLDYTVVPA